MSAGIRQGCPLSPLLFATAMDVLLRALHLSFPDAVVRAFADDTAMLSTCFNKDAPLIMHLFREFATISGLHLNIDKMVVIPLWKSTANSVRRWLRDEHPEWARVEITWAARYLVSWSGLKSSMQVGLRLWPSSCPGVQLGRH